MSPLLSIRELTVRYDGRDDKAPALRSVSLDVSVGERLAIIGESGSGKSTLALAIAGLLPRPARIQGDIDWLLPLDGKTPLGGRDIGFVFQDPSGSLDPVMPIGEQIGEIIRTHLGFGRRAARERAVQLIERVRLPDPRAVLNAYPHQLSGGQRQRVAIAAAIAAGPKLLIADEATSALDTIVQAEIVTLIRQLVAEDGMTLIFISHDIALAAALAERIAVFRHGALVEVGETTDVVTSPRAAYTRTLLDAHLGLDATPLLDLTPWVPA